MGWNVMLVDDSASMRAMIRKIIGNSGLSVSQYIEASNGREALDLLASQWIDLLVVDLNMPVMGGMEMVGQLRERPEFAALPIIVVSTEASQTRIAEIQAKGVHFIHKPFTPAQIRETIQKCCERSSAASPQQIMREVGQNIFENLGGMTVSPETGEGEGKLEVRALVTFSGPFRGGMALDVPESMLLLLTNNMLGLELGFPNAGKQRDTLGELANVMCANLLSRLAGTQAVFNLESPQILSVPGEAEPLPPGRRRTSVPLRLEEGWARLTLMVEQPVASS